MSGLSVIEFGKSFEAPRKLVDVDMEQETPNEDSKEGQVVVNFVVVMHRRQCLYLHGHDIVFFVVAIF